MAGSCRILLDTNIVIALTGRSKALHQTLAALMHFMVRSGCRVCYHAVVLREIRIVKGRSREERALKALSELGVAECGPPEPVLRAQVGRYAKSVKKLGLNDVLIALAARENAAILMTGDYRLATFYASLARLTCKLEETEYRRVHSTACIHGGV